MSYTPPSSDISAKQSEINKLLLQYEQKKSHWYIHWFSTQGLTIQCIFLLNLCITDKQF